MGEGPFLISWEKMLPLEPLLILEKETCNGRETFLQQLLLTLRVLPPRISRATLARLSTISTRLLMSCLVICQGDHKKRAKYRFASKTIMRILPPAKKTEVEGLIAANSMTMDLY